MGREEGRGIKDGKGSAERSRNGWMEREREKGVKDGSVSVREAE